MFALVGVILMFCDGYFTLGLTLVIVEGVLTYMRMRREEKYLERCEDSAGRL